MAEETFVYFCPWPDCSASNVHLRNLMRHVYLMHACERSRLLCGIAGCQNVFSTAESFRKHVERSHANLLHCIGMRRQFESDTSDEPNTSEASQIMNSPVVDYDIFTRRALLFSLKVREQYLLPKSTFSSIMTDVKDLISCYHECALNVAVQKLKDESVGNVADVALLHSVSEEGKGLDMIWQSIECDRQLKKHCKSVFDLIEPEEVVLGFDAVTGKKETYHYVPVLSTVKHYLEHEDVWRVVCENSVKLSNDCLLTDYTDGEAFLTHQYFSGNPNAIRIHGYVDEFEVCNPLGSSRLKHKLTGLYYFIGNVGPQNTSSLRSIHLAVLARSAFVKKYGLVKILDRFLADIQSFELNGISVEMNNTQINVYGSVATMSADNLASHQLGGFRMSFSSGRVCRFCMVSYDDLCKFVSESDDQFPPLRTTKVQVEHVNSVMTDSSLQSVYGVTGPSMLSALSAFDPTLCLPPNCMHDILEGVVPLCTVLQKLIESDVLSVESINERLSRFKFMKGDRENVPPLLPGNFPRRTLLGTASQMSVLLRTLPFLIAELVDECNEYWELYLLLRQICDIVFAPVVDLSWLTVLQHFVLEHHQLLLQYNARLSPKCHFLIHYPRLIAVFGPLRHLWCMRFEAYHSYLKSLANAIGNFKNISKTLSERNQMKKCFEQAGKTCLEPVVEMCESRDEVSISVFSPCVQSILCDFFSCVRMERVVKVQSLICRSVQYAVDDYFVIDMTADGIPVFLHISFLITREGVWCIVGRLCIADQFIRHYHAYSLTETGQWIVKSPGFEADRHAYRPYITVVDGRTRMLVTLRHKLPGM